MTKPPPHQDALLNLIVRRAFRAASGSESFHLSSGGQSPFYIDCKQVSLDAEGAFLIGEAIFGRIKGLGAGGVGGMTLGADPIATAVSLVSHLHQQPIPAFIVRKEPKGHGLMRQVEGPIAPQAKVVVVEDVITTGGSTLRALAALSNEGYCVLKVIALVDRKEGGAARIAKTGTPFESLFTLDDLIRAQAGMKQSA